jgi:mannonate dehydratase
MSIRIAVGQFHELTEEKLRFAAQIGATGIQMNTPTLPGETHWEEKDVRALVARAEAFGLKFEAIENVPVHFYEKAMLGLEGRDEQIENYRRTIRAVGRAGIPVLGYHFMPNSVWRTERLAPARGGAGATKFDMAVVEEIDDPIKLKKFMPTTLGRQSAMPVFGKGGPVITEERMWDNYAYFIKAVLPAAEEEGIRLALHPDDPPVPMLGGVARLFYRPEGFKRAFELSENSPAWALDLCLGCCSEMPGGRASVHEMIEYFGPKGRIAYVHFRDVKGTVPNFTECFIGEGNFNPAEAMMQLHRTGFDGFLLDDHVPKMDDDTDWNHRGRAHAIGYMQGLIRMGEYLINR